MILFLKIFQWTHWYNFHSTFLLAILFRNEQFLFTFIYSAGSKQRATTTLDFEHVTLCSYLSNSLAHFLTLLLWYFCVCHIPACNWFLFGSKLATLRQFVHSFTLQWLPIFILLGTSAPNAELSLATDTSNTHIRGVMQQKTGDHWRPLGLFSRKLTDTESRYSTFDRKLLADHAAIKHFRHFCEERAFQLWTYQNHFVLQFPVFQPPFPPDNNAIWRSSQNLMCSYCIYEVWKMLLPIFYPAQTKQPLDQSAPRRRRIQWISKRWPPSKTIARKRSTCWAAHPSNWLSARQVLKAWLKTFPQATFSQLFPLNSEKSYFDHFHNVPLPGRLSSCCIISSRFVWPGLSSDITAWARGCLACQRGKIHCHTRLVPPTHPHPPTAFFWPTFWFGGPFAVQ